MTATATIYALCDSRETDPIRRIRYIGQTIRPIQRRLRVHWQTAERGEKTHRAAWMRAVCADGGDVEIVALLTVPTSVVDDIEVETIARYRTLGCDLTNTTVGGAGVRGLVVSAETRARQSAAASRRRASLATRAKMSASLKAAYSSPQMREMMRGLSLGRVKSESTRAKMSRARRGEGNGMSKLSWAAVGEIRSRYAAGGVTLSALGMDFGVSAPLVHRVVHRIGWNAER